MRRGFKCLVLTLIISIVWTTNGIVTFASTKTESLPEQNIDSQLNLQPVNYDLSLDNSVMKAVYGPGTEPISADVIQQAKQLGLSITQDAFELRTAYSKHYRLSDGSILAEISQEVQNYQDESGTWRTIRTDLIDEAYINIDNSFVSKESAIEIKEKLRQLKSDQKLRNDFRKDTNYRALQVPFDVVIPKDYSKGYSIGKGKTKVTFKPVDSMISQGSVDTSKGRSNTVYYKDVWNETDVTLEVMDTGLKETIILNTNNAPTTFTFEVNGELNEDVALLPTWLEDANGEHRDVSQVIREVEGRKYVDLIADVSGLSYPIAIDPSMVIQNSPTSGKDASILSNMDNDRYADIRVGFRGNPNYYYWALLYIDTSSIPSSAAIANATISLYYYKNMNASYIPPIIYASAITQSWNDNTVTWATRPSYTTTYDSQYTQNTSCSIDNACWDSWDITSMVSAWTNGTLPNNGLYLHDYPSNSNGNKTFSSSESYYPEYRPKLIVKYWNQAPTPPTNSAPTVTAPNGGETWDGQHTIKWNSAEKVQDWLYGVQGSTTLGYDAKVAQTFTTGNISEVLKQFKFKVKSKSDRWPEIIAQVKLYETDWRGTIQSWWNPLASTNVSITDAGDYVANFNYTLNANTKYAIGLDVSSASFSLGMIDPGIPNDNGNLITLPQGSENWIIQSTDLECQIVTVPTYQYQIQVSTNNGGSWTDIGISPAAATSYAYDFISIPASTQSKIRIRTFDGTSYGQWDESDGFFTIKHNIPPSIPSGLSPGTISAASPQIIGSTSPLFNWIFSDPDVGDTQSQYQVLVYNGASSLIHDSGWITSGLSTYTMPANSLSRNGTYKWQVRVKDNRGAASEFSAFNYVKVNNLPTASITSYTDGQQVTDNILTFTWTYSDADGQQQSNYQILGSQDNWATIGYNSGILDGSATSYTTLPLANGNWTFKLLLKDGLEWSNAAYKSNLVLPSAFEPNETSAQAFPINYNQTYSSLISSATDVDFYKYTASMTGVNRFTLQVPASLNYDVYIYDASMNLIASSIRGPGSAENVLYDVTAGSTYYIKIIGVSGSFSTTSNYSFNLSQLSLQYQTQYQYDQNGNMTNKQTRAQ